MLSVSGPGRRRKQFVVGVDFGTLSARAVLVEPMTGRQIASSVHEYADGVIEKTLPGLKAPLPSDTALQNPADYLEALSNAIPELLRFGRVKPEQVAGLGTAFTSCTMLPVKADATPLCFEKRWRKNPQAWVKLWKHHAAQPEANCVNEVGRQRREPFLKTYGGKYSSEWFFSKLLETLNKSPEVFAAADRFIEAGDWIVWQLCGLERRSLSAAGFKALRVYPDGKGGWTYPSREFFKALHPKLEEVVSQKLAPEVYPLGSRAGGLTGAMARLTGLMEGTAVAVGNIDAHVAVPACTVTTPGKLVMIMGTSTCHLLLDHAKHEVEGMCGAIQDGVVPGLWGYEAGQAGVGDLFAWFMDKAVPPSVHEEARKKSLTVYQLLEKQAAALKPGESGLLALDWWNGNRSVLVDADLCGLLVGLTLRTKPEEIYRALIEATAFGTRKIIEAFTNTGMAVEELYACGGLAEKSRLLLQVYADVTGRPIQVAASGQTTALGAAMQAAVAAGIHPNIHLAAEKMAHRSKRFYQPDHASKRIYDQLYSQYSELHDLFGRRSGSTMKVLKKLRLEAQSGNLE